MSRSVLSLAAGLSLVIGLAAALGGQGPANEFKPDTTFTGSALTGWTPLGAADWQAQDGEIIGRPRAGGQGGWLVLDNRTRTSTSSPAFAAPRRARQCCSDCKKPAPV